ncbi:NAD(P)/FAD-dependent oxidoreductase [Opitutus terrae]|uniref:NADH:ubiquinone reductase (non-electrogenic) n=1 Tax=Opitutus terrae (strain DSM 11246 / JCM 15787 / PB90-1) TaxID=452637 RepID=B1ZXA2_OPITP|nr:NAD(P)/FAD-dependent oxidoreductase [Opitutus terrae]ACB76154.1 NADH dehydrogenase (ubiquinone) [Opitutus terrae PB90-1]
MKEATLQPAVAAKTTDLGGGPRQPRVVVLGAGFGGLAFVRNFPRDLAQITIVDRANYHLFQPLLYQVAAAGLAVPDIAQPVRSIMAQRQDVTVLMDEVRGIDVSRRRVVLHATELDYDYLVVALGGHTSYHGHPEWADHAPGLKSIGDALRIRRQVLQALERAELSNDPDERRRLTTVVVVGGGPTGVELAGAFAELHRHLLASEFRRLTSESSRVLLIENGPRLLPGFSTTLSAKAQRQLESLGVEVRLGTRVHDIGPEEVVLADERIGAATIVWAAGVAASSLGAGLGAPLDRTGRVRVQSDLSIAGRPEVFVVGDLAVAIDDNGEPVPGVSPAAIQMGAHVARTITAEMHSGEAAPASTREPFRYRDKGAMATIGRSRAVARIRQWEFSGAAAWLLWLCVHLLFLIGFRNKIAVLIQWVYSYVTYRPGARVIHSAPSLPPPLGRVIGGASVRSVPTPP